MGDNISNILVNSVSKNFYNEVVFCCPIESAPNGGVHLSTDDGKTWINIKENIPGSYLDGVYFSKSSILYAIGLYNDLYRTQNPVSQLIKSHRDINSITIFPNPTKEKLFLNKEVETKGYLEVLDACGNVLRTYILQIKCSLVDFDIGDLPPSLYLIHYYYKNKSQTCKIIKSL